MSRFFDCYGMICARINKQRPITSDSASATPASYVCNEIRHVYNPFKFASVLRHLPLPGRRTLALLRTDHAHVYKNHAHAYKTTPNRVQSREPCMVLFFLHDPQHIVDALQGSCTARSKWKGFTQSCVAESSAFC